jgi:hypothetical protein
MRITSILITAAVLVGCDSTQKTSDSTVSMGVVNSTCPFSGRSTDGGPVEDYNGTKVGLCCNGCVDAWNDMPDEKKKAYVAKQK